MGDAEGNAGKNPEPPVRLRTRRPCPLCRQPSKQKYHPFCSARCADIDLHRWLGGQYAIPAADPPDFDETAETPDKRRDDGDEGA